MEPQPQSDRETYRLILFSQDRNDVLLATEEAGFLLPCVEIPRWQRVPEHLTAATRSKYGCVAISLFALEIRPLGDNSNGPCYQAMECVCNGEEHASDAVWKSVTSLAQASFQEGADYQALQRCTEESSSYEADPAARFARKGWFTELRSWVTKSIEPLGLQLKRPFRQLNAGPSFSLIRFETNGPAIWFKAVGEPNLREFPTTLTLARLFPAYVPELLSQEPHWNGWLSLEANGAKLSETVDGGHWEQAATTLAKLQVDSFGQLDPLFDSGLHDLRNETLTSQVDPFIDVMTQFMLAQTKIPPPALSPRELDHLRIRVKDSLALLADLKIPDALGHLDLNPANIIVSSNRCVFLDWAEAYVGPPFLSLQYLLEHFRRAVRGNDAAESRLSSGYRTPWLEFAPTEIIDEALDLAPLVAVYAYAIRNPAWRDLRMLRDTRVPGYFRSLTRRMHSEGQKLMHWRTPCHLG